MAAIRVLIVAIVDAGDLEPAGDSARMLVVHPALPPDAERVPDIEPCAASADSLPVPVPEPVGSVAGR